MQDTAPAEQGLWSATDWTARRTVPAKLEVVLRQPVAGDPAVSR